MKKETILLLLLIFSLGLLLPLSESQQTVNILPGEKLSIVYNLHKPTLKLTSDTKTNIAINISKIDEAIKENIQLLNNGILKNKLEIDNLDPGLYQISFISSEIVRVVIQGKGIYLTSLIIIATLLLINLIAFYLRTTD